MAEHDTLKTRIMLILNQRANQPVLLTDIIRALPGYPAPDIRQAVAELRTEHGRYKILQAGDRGEEALTLVIKD